LSLSVVPPFVKEVLLTRGTDASLLPWLGSDWRADGDRSNSTHHDSHLVFLLEYRDQKLAIAGVMARGGVEPPTPRFSVKTPEEKVWPWLQGHS
jgi:hypothetical protein